MSQWITEAQALKLAARTSLRIHEQAQLSTARACMSREQIAELIAQITDIVTVLAIAQPARKAELYGQLDE